MHTVLCLLLALALGLPLTACGSTSSVSIQPPASDTYPAAESPPPSETSTAGDTVATVAADPAHQQSLYLWEEGNVPAVTEYTENPSGRYFDGPDFRPYIVTFPVPEGTEVKGAVLICAGGAFQYRSDENEGTPAAQALSELGYQSFVVNYRLRPYTQEEGALDLARAVRFVRQNAEAYGVEPDDIAVMGFSAGGILAGEMPLHWDGLVGGSELNPDYVPDALDGVSADADAVEAAGVSVERVERMGMPHGFGVQGGWPTVYDQWLTTQFISS